MTRRTCGWRCRSALVMFSGAVVLVGCGGSDPSTGVGDLVPAGDSDISSFCVGAKLEEAAGQPLDEIEVLGLAASGERPISEVFGIYIAEDGNETIVPGMLTPNPEGAELTIIVPPHPAGIGGGNGTLHLTDGKGLSCPPLDVMIEAIDPAPGTTREVADLLGELVRARTQALGSSVDELVSTPANELPLILLPQAMALWALEESDNPDSLQALLEGGGPGEMLDALLAHTDLPKKLESEIGRLRSRATSTDETSIAATSPTLFQVLAPAERDRQPDPMGAIWTLALLQANDPPRNYTRQVLDIPPVAIANAAELSRYMTKQSEAAGTATGATGQLLNDTEYVFIVVGIWAPTIGAAADAAVFVYLKSLESDQKLLPCCFTSMEYELEKPYFEEDYEHPPKYAKWSQVKVVAHNQGWNLTETAITAAEKTLGLGAGFKASHENWDNWLTEVATGTNPGGPDIGGGAQGMAQNYVHNWAKANKIPEIEALTIPSFTWPPIDVTDTPWSSGIAEGAIQRVIAHQQGYAPRSLGQGKLTVETSRGKFGNAHKALAKLVEVRKIGVSVLPAIKRVEPGDEVELRAFVRNSVSPEQLKWKVWDKDGRQLRSFRSEHLGGTEHRIHVTVPREEDRFPIEVEAESTSRTGLRKYPTERRYGSATLTTGVVVDIGPEPACVDTKPPPLQMFAEVVGTENTNLKWQVVSGPARINSDGQVTATGEGEAVVRGTSVVDDRAWDEATIEVGKCTCSYSAILSGDTNRTNVRGGVAHFSTQGKTTIMGTFTNPEALKGIGSIFGVMQDEEGQQTAEEWQREAEALQGDGETLGIALMEMDPAQGMDDAAAMRAVGGFKLQASVMDRKIEPGFAGGLDLGYLDLHTGEYTEGGYPTRYQWAPGAPGNVSLIVNHYNGRSLSGTITGNMFAPGLYKESTREPPQISFSVYFYALPFDPMNGQFGCITAGQG